LGFLIEFFCFCFLVRSTISRQPAGRFTPTFACGCSGSGCSGFWGLAAPGGQKRGKWRFLSDISATRGRIHTKFYLCRDNVCRRTPSPCGDHRPLEGGGGGVKTRFYGVGQKVRKNFEFFTISRLYFISQRSEKSVISPLSNCRKCLDPSVTGFYRVSQKVSDVIPVLRLTPIATEPSTVCFPHRRQVRSRICGTDLRTFWH